MSVHFVGWGILTPNTLEWVAYFHQRMAVMKMSIPTMEAITDGGNSSKPLTRVPMILPLVSALVSEL